MEAIGDEISAPKNHEFNETTRNEGDQVMDDDPYSGYDTVDEEMNDWEIHDQYEEDNPCEINNRSFPSFESCYACYSLSKTDKPHLENGDQIIMPESSIEKLLSLQLDFPMLFEIRNDSKERVSHCGVSEFTADEGTVLLPSWMMKNLQLEQGELISLKSVNLEKGSYVKLQPHSVDFLGIQNPKAALEECLCRKFFCLTVGDTIKINYENKELLVDIVDAKPSSAVCIVDTDCEVDFAPPLDYKEPVKQQQQPSDEEEVICSSFVPFSGVGRRLDGQPVLSSPVQVQKLAMESVIPPAKSKFGQSKAQDKMSSEKVDKTETPQKNEFQPFTGKKYTLSG